MKMPMDWERIKCMSSNPQFPVSGWDIQHPENMYPTYPPVAPKLAEPLPYHRLARTYPAYRWWKPIIVGLIALGFYLALMVLLTLGMVFATLATSTVGVPIEDSLDALAAMDMSDPLTFAFSMLALVLMIPALFWATRIMNVQKLGTLTSVRGTMRWGWLGTCMLVALGVLALNFAVSFLFDASQGIPFEPDFSTPRMWTLILLTLLLVPFQATAEEYVFRGYFMQLLGGWVRHPAFAILLPIPFFVMGHDYDIYGQLDVGLFALAAGWLTWRTGGLEAAIGLHVVNNSVIFLLGAIGLVDVNASEGSLGSLVVSALTTALFAYLIVRLANRKNIQRRSAALPL